MRRLLTLTMLAALTAPAAAQASGSDVIADCARDGRVDGSYSQQEYRAALTNMPTDVQEYTDCRRAIAAARDRAQRGAPAPSAGAAIAGAGGTSAGDVPLDGNRNEVDPVELVGDEERDAVERVRRGKFEKEDVGAPADRLDVDVASAGVDPGRASTDLPAPLIALLSLLGIGLLWGASRSVSRFVVARRQP